MGSWSTNGLSSALDEGDEDARWFINFLGNQAG
nr:hypothetical protein [Tanacetum cinerariifolium]